MDYQSESETSRQKIRANLWLRFLLVLVVLAPIAILFSLLGGTAVAGLYWFWLLLFLGLGILWALLARFQTRGAPVIEVPPRLLSEADQPAPVREVMDVRVALEESEVQVFRGPLREPADSAYQKLKQAFGTPLLQQDEQMGAAIFLLPKSVEAAALKQTERLWINWLLFGITILTTTWVGAAYQGVDLLQTPGRFAAGLPYSLGLLAILGVHELGHFFAARKHGMNVTPPYFIPVPFALGTFGAFIKMRSPSEDRRSLFDVAVAGPLAGLVIAMPALLLGLHSSTVTAGSGGPVAQSLLPGLTHPSILFALLAKIALGPALLHGGMLRLSPLAFAGWLGLFITALNLLPIGQLDGGHIARSMFGTRTGGIISHIALWSLFMLALFVWPGLMTWAFVVFFLAGRPVPPLNDLTPITPARQWLGVLAFVILALILIPASALGLS